MSIVHAKCDLCIFLGSLLVRSAGVSSFFDHPLFNIIEKIIIFDLFSGPRQYVDIVCYSKVDSFAFIIFDRAIVYADGRSVSTVKGRARCPDFSTELLDGA